MAQLRATGPYIWVTWLPRLLSGEGSCEWGRLVQGTARGLVLGPGRPRTSTRPAGSWTTPPC